MDIEKQGVCLFVGRFQPFHNGHLLVVEGMTKLCHKIVIAIGSSDSGKNAENPFTTEERKDMIQRALQSKDIIPNFDVNFIEVPDMESDEAWTEKCLELSGEVSQVWTGNPDTKACFEAKGIDIKDIKEVPGISATGIREMIKSGDEEWVKKVPPEVVSTIESINGISRIKEL